MDGVLAAALLLTGVAPVLAKGNIVAVPVLVGLAVPVVFRRANPISAYAVAVLAGGIQVALGIRPAATDLSILILLYTLAAYCSRRVSVWGLAVCLVG